MLSRGMRAGSVAFLIVLAAFSARPAVAQGDDPPFEIVQLAAGVYAGIVQRNPPMYVFANALIVISDDAVLVVDTHASPSAATGMIERIRGLTPAPVTTIVNTHWHGDHVYGNAAYRQAYPGARIIAHSSTEASVRSAGVQRLREEMAELASTIAERERWLESGMGPAGEALDEAARAGIARSLRLRKGQFQELKDLELLPPSGEVIDSLSLRVGGREVRIYHLGPAHTQGDVIVWLPTERIAFVGDLLEEGVPYADESYPAGWLRALQRLAALDPAIIVPSHGGVQRDRALLEEQLALFRAIVAGARTGYCMGASAERTVEEVAAALSTHPLRTRVTAAAKETFLRGAAERAFAEAVAEGRAACR